MHIFPFRSYNDWAQSAMKQQYDRSYYEQEHELLSNNRHKNSSNNKKRSLPEFKEICDASELLRECPDAILVPVPANEFNDLLSSSIILLKETQVTMKK